MKKPKKSAAQGPSLAQSRDKSKHSTRVRARSVKDSTSAGSLAEAKMLLVLADPKLLNSTTSEKIKKSGVSRATWYRHRNDPFFRSRMAHATREALDEHIGPILHAMAESAKLIGREGHPDRKLCLELLGEYVPGQALDEQSRKPTDLMTDQELIQAFEGREHLLPPGVLRRLGKDPHAAFDRPTGQAAVLSNSRDSASAGMDLRSER